MTKCNIIVHSSDVAMYPIPNLSVAYKLKHILIFIYSRRLTFLINEYNYIYK